MSADAISTPATDSRPRGFSLTPLLRVFILLGVTIGVVAIFMTIESRGNWDFILPFRGRKVLAMAIVGFAIAASTVMFQTVTSNRILTPSIMGFDALYMLIQTVAVFFLGSAQLTGMDERVRFGFEALAMVLFSWALYWWLFIQAERSIHLLVLVGIVFGVMFRSVTNLMQRVIDPTEFAVLQDIGFASFNAVDETLLGVAAVVILGVSAVMWRMRNQLDTLSLGRDTAINLGVNYQRSVLIVLALVSVLVSVSTALVGPITFFGLLVAHLAYLLINSPWHRHILPAAGMIAIITLIAGQLVLERVFSFNTSLSIIIEFAGGITFIVLLLRGEAK